MKSLKELTPENIQKSWIPILGSLPGNGNIELQESGPECTDDFYNPAFQNDTVPNHLILGNSNEMAFDCEFKTIECPHCGKTTEYSLRNSQNIGRWCNQCGMDYSQDPIRPPEPESIEPNISFVNL